MKHFGWIVLVACACLWPGDFVYASTPSQEISVFDGFVGQARLLSPTAEVAIAWPEEGERRKWFPQQPKDFILLKVSHPQGHSFHFVTRQPARQARGKGKAFYHFTLKGTTLVSWDLKMNLGRKVPSRWLQKPKAVKARRSQWLEISRAEQDLDFVISDAVLKHYPPMSIQQKKASMALVEQAAAELGRK